MKLDVFRSLWGWRGDPYAMAAEVREQGFAGVEARMRVEPQVFRAALAAEGLDHIAVAFTGGDVVAVQAWDVARHCDELARAIERAEAYDARAVNVLAGNDRWPLAQQVDFFGRAQALADAAPMPVTFESHRAGSLYSPWLTLEIIAQVPGLRFTADLSHWVVVCERRLDDPLDDLSPFIDRVHHMQARVGYDQGPQVPHPAAPEYADWLHWHGAMWQAIWTAAAARGQDIMTLTPECGADGYTHLLPFTQAPVADRHEMNLWLAQWCRARFAQWKDPQ